jgi:hypothetical protein
MDNDVSDVFLCPRCGEKLKVGTIFCHNCGLKIEENKQDNNENNYNGETQDSESVSLNTIVSRNLCKVTSIILFLEVMLIIGFSLDSLSPSLVPSGDSPLRLVVLAVCFIVASVFYNHTAISKDSKEYKNGEDKGWFLYKGEKDYKILGPLILVWAIFIISLIIATIYS